MNDLCEDPACAQIREWYLADAVKLAKIRNLRDNLRDSYYHCHTGYRVTCDDDCKAECAYHLREELDQALDGEPQP